MSLKYFLKNILYRCTPGGYGHIRRLRKYRDPAYDHQKDKHALREKHYGQAGWKETGGETQVRDYEDYQEYLTHQRLKFDEILKIQGGFSNRVILQYRRTFYSRFRNLKELLPAEAVIVCCGARQGTEVEVLRDMGFSRAYGIDLNPGPDNPFVVEDDFIHMKNPDASVDFIYSNSLDHAFDLDAVLAEHKRVLKPGGYVMYDVRDEEGYQGGCFEALDWGQPERFLQIMMKYFGKVVRVESAGKDVWFLFKASRE